MGINNLTPRADAFNLAESRHDAQCSKGAACNGRDRHIRNDYLRHAVSDVKAEYAAVLNSCIEILDNMVQKRV